MKLFNISILLSGLLLLGACDSNSYLEDLYEEPQASFTTDKTEYSVLETVHFTNTGGGTLFTVWPGNAGHRYGVAGDTGFATGSDGTFAFSYDEPGEYEAVWVASSVNSDKEPVFSIAKAKIVVVDRNNGLESFVISNLYRMREYAGTVYYNSTGEAISSDSIMCPVLWDAWRAAKVNSIQALQLIEFELTSSTATFGWYDPATGDFRQLRSGVSTSRIVNFMKDGKLAVRKFAVVTSSGNEKVYYVAPVMIPAITEFKINGIKASISRDIAFYNRYNVTLTLPASTDLSSLVPEFIAMNNDPNLLDGKNLEIKVGDAVQTSGVTAVDFSGGPVVYTLRYRMAGQTNPNVVQTSEFTVSITQ